MSYTKIVQIGASGNVGAPVLEALVAAGIFEITVVARHNSSFTAPYPSVKVVKVNFGNKQELVDALKGNEAIVITRGDIPTLKKDSEAIIDAAIEAEVKRIIPSEFGNDLENSQEIVFTTKIEIAKYLKDKSDAGQIEYTVIASGPFFDWGLTHQLLGFDIPNKKAVLYGGGNGRFRTTTLGTVGDSVAAVFANPERYKNKSVRVSDFYVTQSEILAVLQAATGSEFTVEHIDVNKLKTDSNAALLLEGGIGWTQGNVYGAIRASIFGHNGSASWPQELDDSENLGLRRKDFEAEIGKIL